MEYITKKKPDNYDHSDIKNLGIGLNNVRQVYRKMLKPDFRIAGRK